MKNFNFKWLLLSIILSIASINTAWADASIYATFSLTDLSNSSLLYEKSGLSSNDQKLNKGERKIEVPCADASGTLYLNGTGAQSDRYASIWGSNGTSYDASRQITMTAGYGSGISFSSSDILTEGGKYYIILGAGKNGSGEYYDYKIAGFKYVLSAACSSSIPHRTFKSGEKVYIKDASANFDFGYLWKVASGNVYAWFMDGGSGNDRWSTSYGTPVEGSYNANGTIYELTVPQLDGVDHEWGKILFTRGSYPAWDAQTWNKTTDETPDEGKNLFYVDNRTDHKVGQAYSGTWGNYTPAGKTVYFDARIAPDTWTSPYIRIGNGTNNSVWGPMSKVAGTKCLYSRTTDDKWSSHTEFAIADAAGWSGKNVVQPWSGQWTGTGNEYQMSKQTNYQKYAIDWETYICPTATSVLEYDCQYYKVNGSSSSTHTDDDNLPQAKPTYAVTFSGTKCSVAVVQYTNDAGTTTSALTSGDEVDPTRIIRVTTTPSTGYQFSELSITGVETMTAAASGTPGVYYVIRDCDISVTCTAKQCTIVFDKNGGSGTISNVTATYDAAMPTKAGNLPTKTGYTFAGFWDGEGGTGTQYYNADGTSKKNWDKNTTSNTTLYAKWTVNNYDLTWNLGGGTTTSAGTGIASGVSANTTSSVAFGTDLSAPTVTKTGYNFAGWDTDVASTMPASNTTYTATWTAKEYSITYKDQGDETFSGTHADGYPTTHTYDTETTLKTATKTGYTFGGWFTSSACTDDAVTSLGATDYTDDITLYAKWTINTYTVTYNANGGSGTTADASSPYDYNTSVTTIANSFTNSGYKFKWWNTNYGGDGEDFYVGEQFTITANTNLYAQWEEVDSDEEFWCGIPDEWHATTHDVTVGDMNVTAKDYSSSNNYINKAVGKDKDYTVVNATDKHATVMAVAGDDYYIEISFTDGSTINELNLGVTTDKTSDQNIVVCYSTTDDFSTGEYEFVKVGSTDNVVSVPGHDQSTKSVTNVSPSTENKYKYVRIYRKLSNEIDYNSTGAALGSSAKARIYSIKAKKGSAGYALTNAGPSNGTIAIKDDGDNAITEAASGETVYITATPSTGYEFTSWDVYKTGTPATKVSTGSTASTSFTMPAYAVTVDATFTAIDYDITHSDAENGTYTISVAGGSATDENTTANYGQTITLAATPSSHYKLQAWNVTKTSSGDEITVTDDEFDMPAEAVTIAPTFGRVYTVTFRAYGGSSVSPIEQSTIGGSITMPSTTTSNDSTFTGWMIGGTTVAAGASYTPTADVYAYATWQKNCAGGGSATLFSQNFNSATAVAYAISTARAYTVASDDNNIVGSTAASQFTSITCDSKDKCGIGQNSSTGGNSENWTGKFGAYYNNTGGYWSMIKTSNFASTAPTAIKVEMKARFGQVSSGSNIGVQFAVGSGFSDGLTNSCPALDKCVAGFALPSNSTIRVAKYATSNGNTAINGKSATLTDNTEYIYTWVINNTASSLSYSDPAGGTSSVAAGCWDLWVGTSRNLESVSQSTTGMSGTTMQNLYIGSPFGKYNKFVLDSIVVTNLNASSCYHITYDGNGADAGYENDARAYSSGGNAWVSTNSSYSSFTREGYEFNGWNNKADGTGTDYDFWTSSDHVVMTQDTTLYAQWRIIIDEDNTNVSGFETPQYKDVAVRNGATLTITEDMSVRNITVESGSTLHVAKNGEEGVTFATKSLSLKGGYYTKSDYSESYDMPRVYINPASKITRTNKTINFDFAVTNNYHPIAVPFPVKVNDVNYVKESLAYIATYGSHYNIKTYDGAARANGSYACWTSVPSMEYVGPGEWEYPYLEPGRGYILAAKRGKGDLYALIRFPMKNVEDDWLKTGELGHYTDGESVTHVKDTVRVTAYLKEGDSDGSKTPKTHKGWNILGIPYMSCYQTSANMYDGDGSATIMQGRFDFDTNTFDDKDKTRYVSVPTHDFSEYLQYDITDEDTKLLPGWCFFVQIETTGRLTFLSEKEMMDSGLPYRAPKRENASMPTVKTGIILSGADASDKTTILVSDKYNGSEYEINADLEKMFGETGYTLATYSLMDSTRLAYNAMNNADIANVIPIGYRAPEEGDYTFSINPRYAENFEQVNLIDYETGILTNLLLSSYTFSTERTQNDARFALNVVPRQETPTDIENGASGINDANGPRKVLINDKMYIIIDGKMYDATGKAVK